MRYINSLLLTYLLTYWGELDRPNPGSTGKQTAVVHDGGVLLSVNMRGSDVDRLHTDEGQTVRWMEL